MAFASASCGGMIEIGDQIEKINNISFIGRRHYEVAGYLRSIPIGETFLLRLISPEKSPICEWVLERSLLLLTFENAL